MSCFIVFSALCYAAVAASAQADSCATFEECKTILDASPNSSAAHYRVAEIYFSIHNYQSAANEFRAVLNGDLNPKWTEVWSHVSLGKIFDATNQRDRAIREYKLAQETNDNTRGALNEAAKYLKTPYQRE